MQIVAFGHQKNVGKDSCAKFLVSHLRTSLKIKNVDKKGFADKIKEICYDLYKWAGLMPGAYYEEHYHLKEVVLPLIGKSPRRLWIDFGTHVGRAVYKSTWTRYLFETSKADALIVSDMRFPEEADDILARGGKVFRVLRPSIQHTSDEADDPLLGYEKWTATIVNDGTLGDLYKKVVSMC